VIDRQYLRDVQYADDRNLNARRDLHRRFNTSGDTFQSWALDQMALDPEARVLEIGCGPGSFWQANDGRVPVGWRALLTDFSRGMVAAARERLGERYAYAVADAEALPCASASIDAVVANHMLYHVPDRARAIREMARVLRPAGSLYAVTNGDGHLYELNQLAAPWLGPALVGRASSAFGLENGGDQLAAGFAEVELRHRDGELVITEAEPLVAYVASLARGPLDLRPLAEAAADRIARDGAIRVRTRTGMFVARAPIQSRS
jgi:SAM-dependent methyltransferase